ncbi:MAG: hypothetical protein LBG27_06025 [Spirochaetaceae bacterium]|nr:hypothetical protein [Spirochaetaceae bacterium]
MRLPFLTGEALLPPTTLSWRAAVALEIRALGIAAAVAARAGFCIKLSNP